MMRTHEAGTLRASHAGQTVTLTGWVARRRDHGGVIFIDLRDASGTAQVVFREGEMAERAHRLRAEFCLKVTGEVVRPARGQREPGHPDRRHRGHRDRARRAQRVRAAALPAGRAHRGRRRGAPAPPLPRPAPQRPRAQHAAAQRGQPHRPHRAARAQVRRGRDADDDPVHSGGCARLPGAGAASSGFLVRAAAVAAAVQAAADGRRHRALLPDRPLLPGRGLPRRPAARVHPARHRDELRRPG